MTRNATMISRWRRHANSQSTPPMVAKAQASMASDTVLSQIRSGCHDRQAPWGRKIDIANTPPQKRPARTYRNAVACRNNGSNQSVFRDPAQAQPPRWLHFDNAIPSISPAECDGQIFFAMATGLRDLMLREQKGEPIATVREGPCQAVQPPAIAGACPSQAGS